MEVIIRVIEFLMLLLLVYGLCELTWSIILVRRSDKWNKEVEKENPGAGPRGDF